MKIIITIVQVVITFFIEKTKGKGESNGSMIW